MSNLKREAKTNKHNALIIMAAMGELYGLTPKRSVELYNLLAVMINSHDEVTMRAVVAEAKILASTLTDDERDFTYAASGYLVNFLFKVQ